MLPWFLPTWLLGPLAKSVPHLPFVPASIPVLPLDVNTNRLSHEHAARVNDKVAYVQPSVKERGLLLHLPDHATLANAATTTTTLWWGGMTRAWHVRGTPWVEDLASQVPTAHLQLQCVPSTSPNPTQNDAYVLEGISEQDLYHAFRVYGRIEDIRVESPNSTGAKQTSATIHFRGRKAASTARNCMQGVPVTLPGASAPTVLHIAYVPHPHFATVRKWVANNMRIVVLFLVALVAGLSYVVFDPIRVACIKAKLAAGAMSHDLNGKSVVHRLRTFFKACLAL
jgi:hypothetical protein